jgi:hypothetical protein
MATDSIKFNGTGMSGMKITSMDTPEQKKDVRNEQNWKIDQLQKNQ